MDRGVKCNVILQKCLAIRLQKNGGLPGRRQDAQELQDYWMYDNGYLLFQGFLEANCKCFWNASLVEAMQQLQFEGYVAQSTLLVGGSPCALEVIRNAWARNVLNAPTNYSILFLGDIEDCLVTLVNQGQFTPLPEALCWVILELTSSGQNAVFDNIRTCLHNSFPGMERPSAQLVYDTLSKLMVDKKIYQTSQGYFIVTPESRRLQRANATHTRRGHRRSYSDIRDTKSLLMTTEEALTFVHGEISTIRDGDVTHQSIQTNLTDVICGGNPQDRVLYPSLPKRSTTFPLERRHSLKLFGSGKKFSNGNLVRSGSMKYISSQRSANLTDSSSSTDTASHLYQPISTKKTSSLLARLFGRGGRKRGLSAPPTIHSFSAQFPPTEWFNPKVIHMHCVGTQTNAHEQRLEPSCEYESAGSCRSYTYSHRRRSKSPRPIANRNPSKLNKPDNKSFTPIHLSSTKLSLENETPSYRNLAAIDRIRRHSISKSSKSLNESSGRIYEEINILHNSSGNCNDIYSKISDTRKSHRVASSLSSPTPTRTPLPKINRRSSSLPRRKQPSSPGTRNALTPTPITDFPYNGPLNKRDAEINKRSASYEDIGLPDLSSLEVSSNKKLGTEMTSLTSSGYDTQTNSIVSTTHELVPYSLKVSRNYMASSTPPSSLTIEDTAALCDSRLLSSNLSPEDNKLLNELQQQESVGEETPKPHKVRSKLERIPSLYSPRELLKSGFGYEQIHFTPVVSEESDLDKLCDLFPPSRLELKSTKIPIKANRLEQGNFPGSLSDLTVNFKSLTAQNILNNVSVTSVDTLVEVNLAAAANNINNHNKSNKECGSNPSFEVKVTTDFGLV